MKSFVVFVMALAVAASTDYRTRWDKYASIIDQKYYIQPEGKEFSYLYDTANNIRVAVNGRVNNWGGVNPNLEEVGSVAYIAPNGKPISWKFKAGVNGYEPEGDILPTPPPTPDHILRLLKFLRSRPSPRFTN